MPNQSNTAVAAPDEIVDDILHLTSDAYCWLDEHGRFLSCSPALFDYLPGLRQILTPLTPFPDVLRAIKQAKLIVNLPGDEDQGNWEEDQLALLLGNEPLSYINHLHNGCSLRIRRMAHRDGRRLLLFHDITSECQARRARALSDEKFKQFAKLSSNWFWDLDSDLRYLYHSSHCQPLAGVDAASLVGKSRIIKLNGMVKDDDQLHEHNACLVVRKDVDVVLTWERPDGETIYSHVLAQPQFDKHGTFTGYLGCGRDVTSFYELKKRYEHQANHDYLTRLLNRRAFDRLLQEAVENLAESCNAPAISSLLIIDLDRFKLINDDGGHSAGDQLLVEIAGLLKDTFKGPAIVARLGGDEFGVHLPVEQSAAVDAAQCFIQRVSEYVFNWNGRAFTISASIGTVEIINQEKDFSQLLRDADSACYAAKRLGRNCVQVFSEQNSFLVQQTIEVDKLKRLKSAIDNERISLYLQPIVAVEDPTSSSKYEVLLRLIEESGEVVGPGEFIEVAEKYDLMQEVDLIIVERSLHLLREFHRQGAAVAFSINLSGNSLSNVSILQEIVNRVSRNQDLADNICFELTETAAISSLDIVVEYIGILRELGCKFALDDFGTGLSSYNYINALKVDYLKIDGSFIRSMLEEPTSLAIVKSINTLSHEMNLRTVAEHVSSEELASALVEINVDYLQGFHYGKPVAIEALLSKYTAEMDRTGTGH